MDNNLKKDSNFPKFLTPVYLVCKNDNGSLMVMTTRFGSHDSHYAKWGKTMFATEEEAVDLLMKWGKQESIYNEPAEEINDSI